MEQIRIDKWLWAARFFKTRSAATEAVLGGRVHVNGGRVKPSKEVRAADTVVVRVGPVPTTVVVTGLSDKRGSAAVAATLYEETPESVEERLRRTAELRAARVPGAAGEGRPTKRDRRRLDALRRSRRGD
jgi:ribosome-associated heat shock protein Hsp15